MRFAASSAGRAPDERPLDMGGLARSLWPDGFDAHWQFVQGPENHDIVYRGREQRVARLGDPGDPRSWYGRSRARVAAAVSLTAPGIPMLFMGQEFLEDKQWFGQFGLTRQPALLHWDASRPVIDHMCDHLRFYGELIQLRCDTQNRALRGQWLFSLRAMRTTQHACGRFTVGFDKRRATHCVGVRRAPWPPFNAATVHRAVGIPAAGIEWATKFQQRCVRETG